MMSRKIKHSFFYIRKTFQTAVYIALLFLLIYSEVHAAEPIQKTDRPVVIVIDPGHGGENEGTKEFLQNGDDFLEKYMTMTTALAMYEELCKYENVEVYLTRNEDKNLTLKQRAKFAKDVQADFLFSIHYNASENHTWYGSEVWISCEPPYHQYGYQFAYNHLENMREMGLFIRGVKSRISESGSGDYYGILRESGKLGIPAVIIEHCHVDNENDTPFCDTREKLQEFGRMDAISVAQYFGLKSKESGPDYSSFCRFPDTDMETLHSDVFLDQTEPEENTIELTEADYENEIITIRAHAWDKDSPLMYYTYSMDGGESFSPHIPWPDTDLLSGEYPNTVLLSFPFTTKQNEPTIVLRVYNKFEKMKESNSISVSTPSNATHNDDKMNLSEYTFQPMIEDADSSRFRPGGYTEKKIIFFLLCISVFLFISLLIYRICRKRRKQ